MTKRRISDPPTQGSDVPKKRGRGRPPVEMPIDDVKKLANLQCTYREMADYFGCSESAVKKRASRDPEFRKAVEQGRATGQISLRRKLFQRAMAGSDRVLCFLAQQHLGMSTKVDGRQELTGKDGGPVQTETVKVYIPDNGRLVPSEERERKAANE